MTTAVKERLGKANGGGCLTGRRETKEMKELAALCGACAWEPEPMIRRAKAVLLCYRKPVWASVCQQDPSLQTELSGRLRTYLGAVRMPDADDRSVSEAVHALSALGLLDPMVDRTLSRMAMQAGEMGGMYYELLTRTYTGSRSASEYTLTDRAGLSRSQMYVRKKEAVLCFGLVFLRETVPQTIREISSEDA